MKTKVKAVKAIRAWAVLYWGNEIIPDRVYESKEKAKFMSGVFRQPKIIPVIIRPAKERA